MANLKYERLGVICQVCSPEAPKMIRTEPIALFDPSNMPHPMNGMNFFPIRKGMSSPFLAGQAWEFMSCPFCKTRPFLDRNQICTPKGIFTLGEEFAPDKALLTKEERPLSFLVSLCGHWKQPPLLRPEIWSLQA